MKKLKLIGFILIFQSCNNNKSHISKEMANGFLLNSAPTDSMIYFRMDSNLNNGIRVRMNNKSIIDSFFSNNRNICLRRSKNEIVFVQGQSTFRLLSVYLYRKNSITFHHHVIDHLNFNNINPIELYPYIGINGLTILDSKGEIIKDSINIGDSFLNNPNEISFKIIGKSVNMKKDGAFKEFTIFEGNQTNEYGF